MQYMRTWSIVLLGISTILVIPTLVFLSVKGFYVDAATVGGSETSLFFANVHHPFFILSLLTTIGGGILGGFSFFYFIGDDLDYHEHKFILPIICAGLLLISAMLAIMLPGNLGVNPLFESSKSNIANIEVAFGPAGNAFLIVRLLGILGFAGAATLSAIDCLY